MRAGFLPKGHPALARTSRGQQDRSGVIPAIQMPLEGHFAQLAASSDEAQEDGGGQKVHKERNIAGGDVLNLAVDGRSEVNFGVDTALANLVSTLDDAEEKLQIFASPNAKRFFTEVELHSFDVLVGVVRLWYINVRSELGRLEADQNASFSANELEEKTKQVKELVQQLWKQYEEAKLKEEEANKEAKVKAAEAEKVQARREIEALRDGLNATLNEAEEKLQIFTSPNALHFFTGTELCAFGTTVSVVRLWYKGIQSELGQAQDIQKASFSASDFKEKTKQVEELVQHFWKKYEEEKLMEEEANNEAKAQAEEAEKELVQRLWKQYEEAKWKEEMDKEAKMKAEEGSVWSVGVGDLDAAGSFNTNGGEQVDREEMQFYTVDRVIYDRLAAILQWKKEERGRFTVGVYNLPTVFVRKGEKVMGIRHALLEAVRCYCSSKYARYFGQLIHEVYWSERNGAPFATVHIELKDEVQIDDAIWVANFFEQHERGVLLKPDEFMET